MRKTDIHIYLFAKLCLPGIKVRQKKKKEKEKEKRKRQREEGQKGKARAGWDYHNDPLC